MQPAHLRTPFHADVRSYRLTQRCRAAFHFCQKKMRPADTIGNRRGFVCQSALSKQLKLREEVLQHEPVIDAPVYADRSMLSHVNTVHLFVRMRSRAHVKLAAVRIQHNASESPGIRFGASLLKRIPVLSMENPEESGALLWPGRF